MRFTVLVAVFAGYGGLLFGLTLFPTSAGLIPEAERLRPYPLQTTAMFLRLGGWQMLVNVAGNLLAFMPLGFLWPLLRPGSTRAWRVVWLAASVSLLIETLQYFSGRRFADVDDILLNALGGLLGYGAYRVCMLARAGRCLTAES